MPETEAVILAGGLGSRLQPVVGDRPKVLAPAAGRPFLTYLFDQIAFARVTRAVLCTGYLANQVREAFGDHYGSLQLVYSEESSPMGTGGALRLALPLFTSDPVLVLNGDSFCDVNLEDAWRWHQSCGAKATLVLVRVVDATRYGSVEIGSNGAITRFIEKSASGAGWVSAGVYIINRSLISTIPEGRVISLEKEIFPAWVGQGFYGYPGRGSFLDIGTPETYALAENFFTCKHERGEAL